MTRPASLHALAESVLRSRLRRLDVETGALVGDPSDDELVWDAIVESRRVTSTSVPSERGTR